LAELEKIEGLSITKNTVFMIMDNDFGIADLSENNFRIDPAQTPRLIWFEMNSKVPKKGKK
jgi:hypothetical protein